MRKAVDEMLEILKDEGVDKIFGNPGSTEMPLMDALVDDPDLTYVLGLQEATAVGMADGHARATGRPSFVNLHTAGGIGNAMGAILNARATRTPMVITAGQQDTRHLVCEPWLSGNLVAISSPAVKWAAEIHRAKDLAVLLRRAFAIADTHPKGPVFLSIPMDILDEQIAENATRRYARLVEGPAPVGQIVDILRNADASNTAFLVSDTVAGNGAIRQAVAVADALSCRVFGTPLSASNNFPTDHRAWRGMLPPDYLEIRRILSSYEMVLYVGDHALLAYPFKDERPFPPAATVIQLCQDRRYAGFNFTDGHVFSGDIAETLGMLAEAAGVSGRAGIDEALERERAAFDVVNAAALDARRGRSPMHPIDAVNRVLALLPGGTTLVNEASCTFDAVRTYARFSVDDEYHFVKGGGLGWGMPAAVGVALASSRRPVVCFIGDGAAMYSPQALWSAANSQADVKFIVFNNRKYDILMRVAKSLGYAQAGASRFVGMDIDKPAVDFRALAATFSLPYSSAATDSDLARTVPALSFNKGPAILEIAVSGL